MGYKLKSVFILLQGMLLLSSLATHADVYRWVDEEGGVHFSDKPKSHPLAEKIEIKMDVVNKDPGQQKRLKDQQHLLSVFEEERKIKQQKIAEEKKKQQERKKKCQYARKTLEDYEGSPLYDKDENGEKVYLSEQEREKEVQRVREAIKYWCR